MNKYILAISIFMSLITTANAAPIRYSMTFTLEDSEEIVGKGWFTYDNEILTPVCRYWLACAGDGLPYDYVPMINSVYINLFGHDYYALSENIWYDENTYKLEEGIIFEIWESRGGPQFVITGSRFYYLGFADRTPVGKVDFVLTPVPAAFLSFLSGLALLFKQSASRRKVV